MTNKFQKERRFRLKLMKHCRAAGRTEFLKRAQKSAAIFRRLGKASS